MEYFIEKLTDTEEEDVIFINVEGQISKQILLKKRFIK